MESIYGAPEDIELVKSLGLDKEFSEMLALTLKSMRQAYKRGSRVSSFERPPFDARAAIRQTVAHMRAVIEDATFA